MNHHQSATRRHVTWQQVRFRMSFASGATEFNFLTFQWRHSRRSLRTAADSARRAVKRSRVQFPDQALQARSRDHSPIRKSAQRQGSIRWPSGAGPSRLLASEPGDSIVCRTHCGPSWTRSRDFMRLSVELRLAAPCRTHCRLRRRSEA